LLEQIASREAFEEFVRGLKERAATGRSPARR
jgi:hypothetical protein